MNIMNKKKVLIIDDEKEISELLYEVIKSIDYEAKCCQHSNEFTKLFRIFNPDIIIMDLHLASDDIDGIELIRFLNKENCKASIILISGYEEKILSSSALLAKQLGLNVLGSIQKPFKVSEFTNILSAKMVIERTISPEQITSAIQNNKFVLYFQPKIDIITNRIIGLEALVRMVLNEHIIIQPDSFIRTAEHYNLISDITRCVIRLAFKQFANWHDNGINLPISINLSGRDLDDLKLPEQIVKMASEFEIDHNKITFEVTESSVMTKPDVAMDILTRMRLKDFSLSIDDFGTGYSSLVELHRLPFSEMKIDKSFIMNVEIDKSSQTICRSIIELGKNLNLSLVAEGTETRESCNFLLENNCNVAQGYYFYKPISPDTLTPKLLLQVSHAQV